MPIEQWTQQDDIWNHNCPEAGAIKLTAEQMGFYRMTYKGEYVDSGDGLWYHDVPYGCPWCRETPAELGAIVILVKKRRDKYRGKRKAVD